MQIRFIKKYVFYAIVSLLVAVTFISAAAAINLTGNDNNPPESPTIDGPTHVKVGVEYEWSFYSTDSDGDNITYYVDWGDVCGGAEWHGPYKSGEEVVLAHKYTAKNTLIINSMAVDEHGAESNMTYFEVTIPRIASTQFLTHLLDRFPNAFPFLRFLMKNSFY